MRSITSSTLSELAERMAARSLSSEEITEAFLDRIARLDSGLGAFVEVYQEAARAQARAADLELRSGFRRSALHGVPVAIKDLCEIEGLVTTGGSSAWRQRRSTCTSTVVERLRAAGLIVLGKTHTVEFAYGGWGTNEFMGTPRNPWGSDGTPRVPGGSSSGSGVAVAARLAPVAIGTDTGGSVRIPSSMNGLTGLKPTFGRVSNYGVVPLARSLDTVGPLARTAADAAMVYDLIRGSDSRDPESFRQPVREPRLGVRPIAALRVARMDPDQHPWPVAAEVTSAVDLAVELLRSLGATVENVKLPIDFGELARNLEVIISAEAWREHGDYIENPDLPFSRAARERIVRGRSVGASTYLRVQEARESTTLRFRESLRAFDVLLTPTLPFGAPRVDEVDESITPMSVFTRPVNYLGGCAISLPCGFDGSGMPLGVQLIAAPWQEELLLSVGAEFQRASDWHLYAPPGLA